ncbi:MAG TPA: hypothetical protein VMT17_09820 [Anaeromyxobacteraceae bacterium]|nr:hypothetical protein [Anaeromyxobacteraceae bacterium]
MAVKVMVAPAISTREAVRSDSSGRGEQATPKQRRRRSAVYDADGHEVLITLMCLKCHKMRPLSQFGLRRMADGSIRNQPWCRTCRSSAGAERPRRRRAEEAAPAAEAPAEPAPPPAKPVDAGLVAAQVAAALAAGWAK